MNSQTTPTTLGKSHRKRNAVIIVAVALATILVAGLFNTTTEVLGSDASGTPRLTVTCRGFGTPTYTVNVPTFPQGYSVTTGAYGHCYFGFYLGNGTVEIQFPAHA